jgi:hypothetical protein
MLACRELADRPLSRSSRRDGPTRLAISVLRVELTVHIDVNPARALSAPAP